MGQFSESIAAMKAGVSRVAEHQPGMPVDEVILMRLAHMAGMAVEWMTEDWLKPHDFNGSEFRALMLLYSSPGHQAFPSELCMWATQKPTNMTRIVDSLLARGLVTRTPSEEDRRRVILRVTPDGRRLVRQLLPRLMPNVDSMFKGFSGRERQQLGRLLEKLLHNLDTVPPA